LITTIPSGEDSAPYFVALVASSWKSKAQQGVPSFKNSRSAVASAIVYRIPDIAIK
jgi:hypothetical protein